MTPWYWIFEKVIGASLQKYSNIMKRNLYSLSVLLLLTFAKSDDIRFEEFTNISACRGKVLQSQYTFSVAKGVSQLKCASLCAESDLCKSFQHDKLTRSCHLNDDFDMGDCTKMTDAVDINYYGKVSSYFTHLHSYYYLCPHQPNE